ncbi:MAG: DNA repair protein RadC [Betaproteobacteria bacterium]|nr:DNA repair protein RadC [Betaproteobacteria bacterium]
MAEIHSSGVRSKAAAAVIRRALKVLEAELREPGVAMSGPGTVRDYLRLKLMRKEREVFLVLYLDSQNRVIRTEEMFQGTLTQTSVHPREVVRGALACNAAAVIFAHNHPSGVAQQSLADEMITKTLREALLLVDVHVLDHFIVAGAGTLSFSEKGLL